MSKTRSACLFLGIAAVIALFLLCVCSDAVLWAWTPRNIKESQIIGDLLIRKLESFAKDNGRYPKELGDIVPKYLDSVPPPRAGDKRWYYSVSAEGDQFGLRFGVPIQGQWRGYPCCFYASDYKFWYVDE